MKKVSLLLLFALQVNQAFGSSFSLDACETKPNAMMIGLNRKILEAQLKFEPFLSWYERQSFGGSKDFTVSQQLPIVEVNPARWKESTFLVDTLLHEAGHLLDYKYQFNKSECSGQQVCQPAAGSWTEISWQNVTLPRSENDFPERDFICLNNCKNKFLDPNQSSSFYRSLYKSGFVSQLSAINSFEDFAETFSLYVKIYYFRMKLKIIDPDGNSHELSEVLNSKSLQKKKAFIEKYFNLEFQPY